MTRFNLVAFVAGLLFAAGLGCAGMTQPGKVIGFLDVTGAWDPSLALVMMGAIGVHGFVLLRTKARTRPLLSGHFDGPTSRTIDRDLVLGAALFGLGWGASGFCPGPALVSLVTLSPGVWAFVGAMIVGIALTHTVLSRA